MTDFRNRTAIMAWLAILLAAALLVGSIATRNQMFASIPVFEWGSQPYPSSQLSQCFDFEQNHSFTSLSEEELTDIVDSLPDTTKRKLRNADESRRELLMNLKRMFSLAQAAQADRLDQTENFKQKVRLQRAILLASEQHRQQPDNEISKAERDAYLASHQKEFEADQQLTAIKDAPAPSEEEIEAFKSQWAEMMIRAERACQSELNQSRKVKIQARLQYANALANEYSTNLSSKLKPTAEELKKYREEHPEADLEKIRAIAEGVLTRAKAGEDFAELAKQFGQDSSAGNGGDLGWFTREKMVREFSDAVFALQPGQFTQQLVKTQFGFHIIRLEALRKKRVPDTGDEKSESGSGKRKLKRWRFEEEARARHILISTQDAEAAEQKLTQEKMHRALEEIVSQYSVSTPEDFSVNVQEEVSPQTQPLTLKERRKAGKAQKRTKPKS